MFCWFSLFCCTLLPSLLGWRWVLYCIVLYCTIPWAGRSSYLSMDRKKKRLPEFASHCHSCCFTSVLGSGGSSRNSGVFRFSSHLSRLPNARQGRTGQGKLGRVFPVDRTETRQARSDIPDHLRYTTYSPPFLVPRSWFPVSLSIQHSDLLTTPLSSP